jgi:hypothetical protein
MKQAMHPLLLHNDTHFTRVSSWALKNAAQAPRYSSIIDVFPGSFTATEHFTDGVEPCDDHNRQPEIQGKCVPPNIVTPERN